MATDNSPRVLLVGASHWGSTLVLAQRLHRAGLSPVVIDQGGTRFDVPFVQAWRTGADSPQALRAELLRWRGDERLRLVLPMLEDHMTVCAEVFSGRGLLLQDSCSLPLQTLLSKSAMIEQARQAGLAVPRTRVIGQIGDALETTSLWGYPVMLKGDRGHGGATVRRCDDAGELRAAFAELAGGSQVFIQEHLCGPVWGAGGFFDEGRLHRVHIYEQLRDPGTPAHAPPERIRHHTTPQALESLRKLGRHLNWSGYGQIDFIHPPAGEPCFLEFNPRPWGSITGADAAGNDLLGALAQRILEPAVDTDLDNREGWCGLVYPKPLVRLARQGQLARIVGLLLKGELHRSRPMHSWSRELEQCLLRVAYWSWLDGRRRRL